MKDLQLCVYDILGYMIPGFILILGFVEITGAYHHCGGRIAFYDGNGRTGRIINVLYLVKEGLLDTPVLYLSSYIVRTKTDYYRLLQAVRVEDCWEDWVIYMLEAIEQTATIPIAIAIKPPNLMINLFSRSVRSLLVANSY